MKKLHGSFYGFLILSGIFICWGSLQLGYGSMAQPGSGFLPFWCGLIVVLISAFIFLSEFLKKKPIHQEKKVPTQEIDPSKPFIILGGMVMYCQFLEALGFILCTYLFLVLIFRFVWKRGWKFNFFTSLFILLAFYGTFQVLMEVRLPQGILREFLFR